MDGLKWLAIFVFAAALVSQAAAVPSINFTSQVPPDINALNVVGTYVNITYNITSATGLNGSNVTLYYLTNSSGINYMQTINGTAYNVGGLDALHQDVNTSKNFTWEVDDNQIYPAVYNINESALERTPKSILTLSTTNSYAGIELIGVNTTTAYGFFEAYVNRTAGGAVNFYYCNSTYSHSSQISTDPPWSR